MVETKRSFCRFCMALCGIDVEIDGDRVLRVRGVDDDPLSGGYTCAKGRGLPAFHHHETRLDRPMLRVDGALETVSWEQVLGDLGAALRRVVDDVGPDGVAFYFATGAAFDAAGRRVADRFVRALGSRSKYSSGSIDTPCKPMIAEMMAGSAAFNPTVDWDGATLTLLVGSNPVVSHGHASPFVDPVRRLRELTERGEVWVVDPRRTETARLATRHLPIRPGSDHVLLAHLVRAVLQEGVDHEYVERHVDPADVETVRRAVAPFDLDRTVARTGLDAPDVSALVAAIRHHGRVAGLSGTGSTMSSSANCTEWLLWVLLILTGSLDRPRGIWFNPGFLRQMEDRRWEPASGRPDEGPASRPDMPRWVGEYPVTALYDEIEAGNVRALVVLGGNPLMAFPDVERITELLSGLDVLAALDVAESATTRAATHVLPVAGQLERPDVPNFLDQFQPRISTRYTEAVVAPAAERRAMWWVLATLADELGLEVLPEGVTRDGPDEQLLVDLGDRSRAGSFAVLRSSDGPVVHEPSTLFGWALERLPDRRWRLAPPTLVEQLASLPAPDGLLLTARREVRHVNSALVGVVGQDEPRIWIHPRDAGDRDLADGDRARVASAFGELAGVVSVTADVVPGAISVPHGYESMNVSRLTSASDGVDPLTGMVLQTGLEVSVSKLEV